MRGILALAFAAGCYSPHYEDCAISCTSNACPSGFECRSGVCRSQGATDPCTVSPDDDAAIDSPVTEGAAWGSPTMLDLDIQGVVDPSVTEDLLELYVVKNGVIYSATRTSPTARWGFFSPINISGMTGVKDQTPSISPDGLTLMFSSDRPPSMGGQDLWIAHRLQRNGSPWNTPVTVDRLNTSFDESGTNTSSDGKTIVFGSTRTTGMLDIFIANRADVTLNNWSVPAELASLNAATTSESHPSISPDLLTIYFQSNRNGSVDLFTAHRTNATLPFEDPTPITELNSPMSDGDPWVSPDGHHIFFSSNREGSMSAIWEASR
jgi:hypothetical protein